MENHFYFIHFTLAKPLAKVFLAYSVRMALKGFFHYIFRSSRSQIVVLKKLAIFIGKDLCWSLFLIKLQACDKTANFNKEGLKHRSFSVNMAKFLRTAFFIRHLWWLLLHFVHSFLFDCRTTTLRSIWQQNCNDTQNK